MVGVANEAVSLCRHPLPESQLPGCLSGVHDKGPRRPIWGLSVSGSTKDELRAFEQEKPVEVNGPTTAMILQKAQQKKRQREETCWGPEYRQKSSKQSRGG